MVVHHQAVDLLRLDSVLPVGKPPVDPGDGLKQTVLSNRPIQVEGLLHRCIKAREQHVNHDEYLRRPSRVYEGADDLLLVELTCSIELGAVVVSGGNDGVGAHAKAVQMLGVAEGPLPCLARRPAP